MEYEILLDGKNRREIWRAEMKFYFWVVLLSSLLSTVELHSSEDPCEVGMVPCTLEWNATDFECVHQRQICNKVEDCSNGEDERDCVDKSGDDKRVHSILNRPILSPKEFHRCSLKNPPDFCKCKKDTKLSCQFANLTNVPHGIDPAVTHLLLGSNQLVLQEDSFSNYPNLIYLQLDSNQLASLPNQLFEANGRLNHLLISSNLFTHIDCNVVGYLSNLITIFIDNNKLTDIDHILQCIPSLHELFANSNNIDLENRIGSSQHPTLLVLSLEQNRISRLTNKSFEGLSKLSTLYLRHNKISIIMKNTFKKMNKLVTLDLSYNSIRVIDSDTFFGLKSLANLDLIGNPIVVVSKSSWIPVPAISSLHLEEVELHEEILVNLTTLTAPHVHFKRFRYCSYLPHIRDCRPKSDGVSSFDQLLVRAGLRVVVWVVTGFTILGNIVVLHGRTISRDDNKVVSLFIRNLAVADLLTGCYLLVIAIKDQMYRGAYHQYAFEWMRSWTCTVIGIVGMISCEVSVLLLTSMSLERWICISWPMKTHCLTSSRSKVVLTILWATGISLAILPAILYRRGPGFYGSNGMCFPIHLEDPLQPGWIYSAFLFIGVNQIGVLTIIASYAGMFYSIQMTRASTPLAIGDREFAFRFFFIVLTDCLCWTPIIVLKTLAILNVAIPADVYAFVVVILLPVNSAINPWLYTFTTHKFRARTERAVRNWRPLWKRTDSADSEVTRLSFIRNNGYKLSISGRDSLPIGQSDHFSSEKKTNQRDKFRETTTFSDMEFHDMKLTKSDQIKGTDDMDV